MRRILVSLAVSLGFLTSPVLADSEADRTESSLCEGCEGLLELALANPRRDEDRARDQFRHPAETLAFFKVRPGMTVVDYLPSGGWYTRILAPYLGADGHYLGVNPDVSAASEQHQQFLGNLASTFPAKAAAWTGLPAERIGAWNSDALPRELDGTVDRVLIFREMHNIVSYGWFDTELTRLRGLLKDDGMLGIVQHRAKADAPDEYVDGSKGYMRQADVIKMIEAKGFTLVATSEVNANPKDTADYPDGVWTLPPALTKGDDKREYYSGIGESDRMTLLFRKRPL